MPESYGGGDGAIVLARYSVGDAPALVEADRDAEHRQRFETPADHVASLAHAERVIARWQSEWDAGTRFVFAMREIAQGEVVGGCELRPLEADGAALSYWTLARCRRRGFATRAVRIACDLARTQFGFRQLEAEVDADNVASQRVVQRVGFTAHVPRSQRLRFVCALPAP